MKKIGEATILIVADVLHRNFISIRSFFCSRSIVYEEQSSFRKTYFIHRLFCSHAYFEYPPLECSRIPLYCHNGT